MGPFDAWPTGGGGFEHFYGFIGGETNQYAPGDLRRHRRRSSPTARPEEGYHFTEDMTDRAIDWVRQQKALMPDKPFFVYFAPGATHAPHHVPTEWSDKYKGAVRRRLGRAARARRFARQKELGVIPADAELTARPDGDPGLGRHARRAQAGARPPDGGLRRASWSTPTTTSAGSSTRSTTSSVLDDTLVYYIIGDNGASAEGTLNGTLQRD